MTPVSLLLYSLALLQFAINLWLTKRARQSMASGWKRSLLIISVWILPFFGAFWAFFDLPRKAPEPMWKRPEKLPKRFLKDAPPAMADMPAIHAPGAAPFTFQDSLQVLNGIPVFNWLKFENWLNSIPDQEHRKNAIQLGHRAWLSFMRQAIGPHCYLYESDEAIVLATLEPNVIMAGARFIKTTKERIRRILREIARFPVDAKSILLVFDDAGSYQRYCSIYNPRAGQNQQSSGMFIGVASCPHFVTMRAELLQVEPVITHELVHSAVQWLDIPLWLNEGMAVSIERRLHQTRGQFNSAPELVAQLQAFWDESRIQQFWSGTSFHRDDAGTPLSYELAHILVENLAHQQKEFIRFVLSAKRGDAGAIAARKELSLDLGAAVCILLERNATEKWSPHM